MSLYFLVGMVFLMGAACGFYLGCKVPGLNDGIGEADEYKPGDSD